MNTWNDCKNYDIAQSLIQEEIDRQTGGTPKLVCIRCVEKKRMKFSVVGGIITVVMLHLYMAIPPLERGIIDLIPIVMAEVFWLVHVCLIDNKHAAFYLMRESIKSPDLPFEQVVSKNIKKKKIGWISAKRVHMFLCLAVMLSSFLIPISNLSGKIRVDGMIYKFYENGYVLLDCESDFRVANVIIPEEIDGKPVLAIDSKAFAYKRDIISVSIPDSVTKIGDEAFLGCTRLKSIVIPHGVTEIPWQCFKNCTNLYQVTLHDGITSIYNSAFLNCYSLEQINLPASITGISDYCFANCISLKSIVIPEGVMCIGVEAFLRCKELEFVSFPYSLQAIYGTAFKQCSKLKNVVISKETLVNERAFEGSPTDIIRR